MPCFVVSCNSGYSSCKEKVPLFHPPKEEKTFLKWRRAIPKRNLALDTKSRICAKHFRPEEVEWFWTSAGGIKVKMTKPRLVEGAVPSIFPNCPKWHVPNVPKLRRKVERKKIEKIPTDNTEVSNHNRTSSNSERDDRTLSNNERDGVELDDKIEVESQRNTSEEPQPDILFDFL